LQGDESGRAEAGNAEAGNLHRIHLCKLVERDLDAHGQFQRSDVLQGQVFGDGQQVVRLEDVVVGVTAGAVVALVAPGGYARADRRAVNAGAQRVDAAHGLMAGLAGLVGIGNGVAGEHRLAAHDVQVPVRAGGDAFDAGADLAGAGFGHGLVRPYYIAGSEVL